MKKWLKIDDGVIFLRYICRKGCIINQKGLKFGRKKQYLLGILCMFAVTSFAEVWIEIGPERSRWKTVLVTSFAEVWIEIEKIADEVRDEFVTSFAEVWIEICFRYFSFTSKLVTSFAEVWIEISLSLRLMSLSWSLPSRKCGLKYLIHPFYLTTHCVTSFAEVWIEIVDGSKYWFNCNRHFLRGSVD